MNTIDTSKRLCVFCKHFTFWGATGIGQEGSGGEDATSECGKHHWTAVSISSYSEGRFREAIKTAVQCADYDETEDAQT